MKIEKYYNFNNLQLSTTWKAYENRQESLSPFLCYEYLHYIYRYTLFFSIAYIPIVFCVKDENDEILMIVPMKLNFIKDTLKMLGDLQGCGCTDAVFKPDLGEEEKKECTRFFLRHIRKKANLRRLQAKSVIAAILKEGEQKPSHNQQVCVSIHFGNDIDEHIRQSSSSVRQNLRTAYNRMRRNSFDFRLRVWEPGTTPSAPTLTQINTLYLSRLFGKYKQKKANSIIKKLLNSFFYRHIKADTRALCDMDSVYHFALCDRGGVK